MIYKGYHTIAIIRSCYKGGCVSVFVAVYIFNILEQHECAWFCKTLLLNYILLSNKNQGENFFYLICVHVCTFKSITHSMYFEALIPGQIGISRGILAIIPYLNEGSN